MAEIDPRIVRVGIEVNGVLKVYEGLNVLAQGTKCANAIENECEVRVSNLDKATRDYILTETSPFNANRSRKKLTIEAGRKSFGTALIFAGEITDAAVSQPPDVTLTLKAQTASFAKGDIIARNQPGTAPLSRIARQVAADLGLSLRFEATDKQIGNFAFTGSALRQVDKLGSVGAVNAYVDDNALVVKNYNAPLKGRTRVLNASSGMIGIPEITEQGVRVKFLIDNQTILGGGLQIQSEMNPAANGLYTIFKLGFQIASRDTPFYFIAEAKRT